MIQIIKEQNIDYVIPCCEEIFYIAKYKNLLEEYTKVFCMDINLLNKLHNKYEFIKLLQTILLDSSTIKIPYTKKLSDYNYKSFSSVDIVVKRIYSRFSSSTIIKPSHNELLSLEKKKYIIQEFAEGYLVCSYSIAINGRLTAHTIYRAKYQIDHGAGLFFENIDNDLIQNSIYEFVKSIVFNTNFSGQIAFDFLVNGSTITVIEANPRLTSGIHCLSNNPDLVKSFFEQDLNLIWEKNYRSQCLLPIILIKLFKLCSRYPISGLIKDLQKSRNVLSEIKFLNLLSSIHCLITIANKYKISVEEASTFDIEWNGNDF